MAALDADEKERFGSLIFYQSGIYLPLSPGVKCVSVFQLD